MSRTIRRLIASVICISVFTIVGSVSASPPSGSDAALRSFFLTHRADFDKLAAMAEKDIDVTRIAPKFTWLSDDVAWPRKNIGFSAARWDKYRKLFLKLNLPAGIRKNINPSRIFCPVVIEGLVPTGYEKGFVYSQMALSPLVNSLDVKPPDALWNGSHVLVYKQLDKRWYLYYEQW